MAALQPQTDELTDTTLQRFPVQVPITVDGLDYHSSEHYFQSQKFLGSDAAWRDAVRAEVDPLAAKRVGRSGARGRLRLGPGHRVA